MKNNAVIIALVFALLSAGLYAAKTQPACSRACTGTQQFASTVRTVVDATSTKPAREQAAALLSYTLVIAGVAGGIAFLQSRGGAGKKRKAS